MMSLRPARWVACSRTRLTPLPRSEASLANRPKCSLLPRQCPPRMVAPRRMVNESRSTRTTARPGPQGLLYPMPLLGSPENTHASRSVSAGEHVGGSGSVSAAAHPASISKTATLVVTIATRMAGDNDDVCSARASAGAFTRPRRPRHLTRRASRVLRGHRSADRLACTRPGTVGSARRDPKGRTQSPSRVLGGGGASPGIRTCRGHR